MLRGLENSMEALMAASELPLSEALVAQSLSRHAEFVRLQESADGDRDVIAAWRQAENNGLRTSVRSSYDIIRSQPSHLPSDVLERFNQAARSAQADYDRLMARFVNAGVRLMHQRMDLLVARIDRALQHRYNRVSTSTVLYDAEQIKSRIRGFLRRIEHDRWTFLVSIFGEADHLERRTSDFERTASRYGYARYT
ncbi:hypothetical protein BKA66DRAFT_564802 [Pyrenochaeta sp. MPI-SDFR-AT-0127]|nr:hypothetical protein BKA66DRAFT_564802 [Pyrenochaeta sp. MPI-SDFR-AT-0127]